MPRDPQPARRAATLEPRANLALISVPGEFAAAEARKALERGLHAMSSRTTCRSRMSVALKRLARERGLLRHGTGLRHRADRRRAARLRQRRAARRHRHRLGVGHRPAGGVVPASRAWAAACRTASASAGATSTSASARSASLAAIDALEQDAGTATHRADLQAARAARRGAGPASASPAAARNTVVCFLGLDRSGTRSDARSRPPRWPQAR